MLLIDEEDTRIVLREGDEDMAIALELRDWQKRHLTSLLRIKQSFGGTVNDTLRMELENAVIAMEQEDVAYCEKIIGIKAI